MRALGIVALAGAAALTASSTGQAQQPDTTASAETCELHVSGSGRPNFIIRKSIMIAGEVPSPEAQRERFRTSPFNTATRAQALPDNLLIQLLPNYRDVRIVRHAEIIDTDQVDIRSRRTRVYPSTSPCYADLVLTDASAIWTSTARPNGMVSALIIGGDRAIASFQLNLYEPGARRPAIYRKRLDSPIASPASDMRDNPGRLALSLTDSYADALRQFAEFVAKERRA